MHLDPLTGDLVTTSERISLAVQAVMRQWKFVLAYTILTVFWWYHPHWFGDTAALSHWQDWASYMALLIESVVGIGMFSWARRDSIVLRKIHKLEHQAGQSEENAHILLHDIYKLTVLELEQIRLLTEIKHNGNGFSLGGDVGNGDGPSGPSGNPEFHLEPPHSQGSQNAEDDHPGA